MYTATIDFFDSYMDYYDSPEELIRVLTVSRSKFAIIGKDGLAEFASENGISIYRGDTKAKIFDKILKKMTFEEFADLLHIGVRSDSFQKKFGITSKDVRHMAKCGFIHVTGAIKEKRYSKNYNVYLYSVFDYFRLTKEDIWKWIAENPRK